MADNIPPVPPDGSQPSPPRLSPKTPVRLPPKIKVPHPGLPSDLPSDEPSPPLGAKGPEPIRSEPRKSGAQHIPPIKLNVSSPREDTSDDSIFLKVDQPEPVPKPEKWKNLEPGELPPREENRQSRDVFEHTAPHVVPPMLPPPLPPSLARSAETFGTSSLHVAPPLLEKAPEPPPEKLLPPHLPTDTQKGETSSPFILSSSSPKASWPKVIEGNPALKPAVFPTRLRASPRKTEGTGTVGESDAIAPAPSAAQPPGMAPQLPGGKEEPGAEVLPVATSPDIPVLPKAPESLPLTRAARARKRRLWEMIIFYVFFAGALFALFFGGLHFGRETRLEGQVIPPSGMTLGNEVWIVADFSSYASGIAEDLAKARTPGLQDIQERRDHVQRAQADVASREERIRLIQAEIQASKDEVISIVKKSRIETQKLWDGEGAQIDNEYASRFNQLQSAISTRAKSLNLKYQPDTNFQSPEVWANAYRLALYEVPTGVDTVKEHQWLGDQMKQWRDFLKTLDDRKEQLREKAAQIKLAPASRITDLNTKIDELQQRSDSTASEEIPLKAELQQAQIDLVKSQTSEAGLDDKYYQELDSLPQANVTKHIPLAANGRFTWVDDDVFAEGEKERHYWIFARATRADGRQYWALQHIGIDLNQTLEIYLEPTGFISTKAILRPDLSPEEQEQ